MDRVYRADKPEVDESTVMYRNPLGDKAGKHKIIVGVVMSVIAAALVAVGIYYITAGDVSLGIILIVATAAYGWNCVMQIRGGIRLLKQPYSIIIDKQNLIVREKKQYVHLPLSRMHRLTIDCEGIEAQLSVKKEGNYDIVIKGSNLYYKVDGVQNSATSQNMRKVAFILNSVALGKEKDTDWGARYDELLASEHVEQEGAAAGLNKELDQIAASEPEQKNETVSETESENENTANAEETAQISEDNQTTAAEENAETVGE